MKQVYFKIPIYEWDVSIVTIYNEQDEQPLRELLTNIDADKEGMQQDLYSVRTHAMNGGDTWRDPGNRRAIIVIFPWSDMTVFWEVINHEKRHLVDRILEWANINDMEAAAYLDGAISKMLFSKIKELL